MLLGRSDQGLVYVFDRPARILAVDDDPLMREFAASQLAHPGGEVVTAEDGEQAWEILQQDEVGFDLVLSDLEMPNMTGFSLCEAIRSSPRHAHLPVVVITGRDDMFAIDRAYETGATSFATKPVNWRLLGYQLRYVMRAVSQDSAQVLQAQRDCEAPPSTAIDHGPVCDSVVTPTLIDALRHVATADGEALTALLCDPALAEEPALSALLNRLLERATPASQETAQQISAPEGTDLPDQAMAEAVPAPHAGDVADEASTVEILDDAAIAPTAEAVEVEADTARPIAAASRDEKHAAAQIAAQPGAANDTIARMRAQLASRAGEAPDDSTTGNGRLSSALSFFRNRSLKRNGQS
jgi:CheY-like chemotaxis protein